MINIDSSKIIANARRTLGIEIEALENLRAAIDGVFCAFVEAVFHARGRVVVTGVGKSAIVAQKIAATLNSTGTPALFMHAADAIHGDLGMIQPGDVVLCLSKSGDTPEIKVLLPLLRGMGNSVAAMTANAQSWLGTQADFVLLTPILQEADPNNLAPTASTTAQMALGDALAIALLSLRGFTPGDFAQFHPGGTLGKQLYLRVGDLSSLHERPAVSPATKIPQAILEMTTKRLGCTVVLDDGEICGIVTDGDLRRMLERHAGQDFSHLTAAEVMSASPKTIEKNDLAAEALALMRQHSITQLVVVENGAYCGIVHLHDLIREGLV
ncbi:MAG: KpsF/GutQ family sugar-phosphate isomerase [Bacteroidetes bacterium]|nr:KpsF/GutQ family sugar-phosphate isomerase [Bacteroidota bacterium]